MSTPRPDTDLSDLDPAAARDYTLRFIASLRETRKQRVAAGQQCTKWEGRVALAHQKGENQLAEQAQALLEERKQTLTALQAEESDLVLTVGMLQTQLRRLQAQPEFSVDAQQLLANLADLVGEPDALRASMTDLEASEKLQELKKRMGADERPG